MPPARKTAPKATPAAADGTPLLELRTAKTKKPAEMEPAFSVDGRVFSIPVEVKAHVAIRYMDLCRKRGENYGVSWLLEKVLGKDAYDALLEFDDLEDDDLLAIVKIIQSKVLGDTTPKD